MVRTKIPFPRRSSRLAAFWPLAIRLEPGEARRSVHSQKPLVIQFPAAARGRAKLRREANQSTAAVNNDLYYFLSDVKYRFIFRRIATDRCSCTGASVSFWSGSPGRCDGRLAAGKAQPLQAQAPKPSPSGSVQPITPPFPAQKTTGRRCSKKCSQKSIFVNRFDDF